MFNCCGLFLIVLSSFVNCLTLQVRLFDSVHYLKAFGVGDVWVAVGWSNDVIPAAKRLTNVAVIVPKSGASIWADLWVCMVFNIFYIIGWQYSNLFIQELYVNSTN